MNRILSVIIAVSAAALFHSCFTGVESTPRIDAGDVRRVTARAVNEDSLLAGIVRQPFREWTPGKEFLVADSKIRLLFGTSLPAGREMKGHRLVYLGHRDGTDFAGQPVVTLLLSDTQFPSDTLEYRIPAATKAELPFTIDLDVVSRARSRLEGRTFYLLTRNRRDSLDNIIPGRRYVPVTVENVTPGTELNPIKVELTDDHGSRFYLFMPPGTAQGSPRRFGAVLSVADPRSRYPQITGEVWEKIINGQVATGMTRDECRLALGKPATVERIPGQSYLYERWTFDNGIYLIFEDGLLTDFRR